MRHVAVIALLAAILLALLGIRAETAPAEDEGEFPHILHEGLFFDCSSCHAGIAEDEPYSVTPEDCARCHNEDVMGEVDWTPPVRAGNNLLFTHEFHVGDAEFECAECHLAEDADGRMDVVSVTVEACLDCHGIDEHFAADNDECDTCHSPLHESAALSLEAIAAFPMPDDHGDPGFLSLHGEAAMENTTRCATCHTQELCERCHLNADSLEVIQALGSDPRLASLAATRDGDWPIPANHMEDGWERTHGTLALESASACATCHTQESCTSCHGDQVPLEPILALRPAGDPPRGVLLPDGHPPLHGAGFETEHAAAAGARDPECEVCHTRDFCEDCHVSPSTPSFHMVDYVSRHASDAYAREQDCASCHQPETFCRSCHIQVGTSPESVFNNAFHDKWGNWLIAHAPLARQSIEACASCHQQNDCLRCHSQAGWGISPHGPGFDAERMRDKNPLLCARCHFD